MVGRGREQQLLQQLFERTAAEGACHLVSVLGSAGVGKSRLVDEFVAGLGDQASVLRGHCPAFGDSVTMWPMVEVVRQAAGIAPDDSPEQARARLAELLAGVERGNLVTERIAQLLGFGQDAGLPEDTFWALERLLETLARRRPLVLVIDDLQWAHPILLDAVEHVAEYADAPLMLLCMARPDELFSRRAQWPGGKANILSFLLSPLPEREGEQLVVHLLGGRVDQAVHAHVSEWAQGFPLLVEELVSNLRDAGRLRTANGRWTLEVESEEAAERRGRTVPTSIHTLLLARLDRLGPRGRAVIEPAAVVGQQFHLGDVEALHPDAPAAELATGLQELVRLDLIRADHGPTSTPLSPTAAPAIGSGTPLSRPWPTDGCPTTGGPSCMSATPTGWSARPRTGAASSMRSSATISTRPSGIWAGWIRVVNRSETWRDVPVSGTPRPVNGPPCAAMPGWCRPG